MAAIAAADRAADAAATASATPEQAEAAAIAAGTAAREAAMATREAGSAAGEAAGIDAALTPQGFDAARVRAIIDASALSDERKAALAALLDRAAQEDPAALAQALEQIRAALP
ncbi:MAG: hypothetical protein D1H97_05515, partial [Paracoccus sp. BP8]